MSAPLVFMDTETTGLSLDDDIWEFAAIRREPDGTETEHHIFIEHNYTRCSRLPESFREDHVDRYRDHKAYTRRQACSFIADVFRNGKPHVVGAVPNFDTERIARMFKQEWPNWPSDPGWHYHLIDVENLAVGWLAARGHAVALPWDSDAISAACGVVVPIEERHTAMGDARWARALYDAVCLPRTTFGGDHPAGCVCTWCVPTPEQSAEVAEVLSQPLTFPIEDEEVPF